MVTGITYKFRASLLFGGKLFSDDIIEIRDSSITLRRNRWFIRDFYSITIPLSNIINVQVMKHNPGAEIIIESHTKNQIISKGYSYSSACKMKELLMQ